MMMNGMVVVMMVVMVVMMVVMVEGTEETDQERHTRLQTTAKRRCVRQVHESGHERCTRPEQNAKQQATTRISETHEQTQERGERYARCHRESRCGTATTEDQTTEGLDHNGNAAGSESHSANKPKWRRHTDAFKQNVRDNLNRFHESMSSLQFATCELCHEAWPAMKVRVRNNLHVCDHCHRDKSIPKLFSSQNNPIHGPVPQCLSQLSVVEEMMIAQIAPMMQMYVLPFGQYGYRGNVLNLPQGIQSLATFLPRTGKSVGVITVRLKGKNDSHKDFRVTRDRVQEALLWLRRNNRYYCNIEIDYAALNALPDDGPLPDLQVIEDDDLIQPADTADDITDTAGVNDDTEFSDDDSDDGSDDGSDAPFHLCLWTLASYQESCALSLLTQDIATYRPSSLEVT